MADPIPGAFGSFGLLDELLAERAGGCDPARLAALEAENACLRAKVNDQEQTIATLRERVVMADEELAIYRNPKLGAAKDTAAAVARIFRAERPTRDAPAGYRTPLAKVAGINGKSEDAISRQLTTLAGMTTADGTPILIKEVITVPEHEITDEATGEIITIPLHRETWIGPGVDRAVFAKTLATLNPAERKAWGGKIDRAGFCPDHPRAGVIKRTRHECAVCHRPITHDTVETLTHDAYAAAEAEQAEPNPQDAAITLQGDPEAPSSPLVASVDQTRKMPVWPDEAPTRGPVAAAVRALRPKPTLELWAEGMACVSPVPPELRPVPLGNGKEELLL